MNQKHKKLLLALIASSLLVIVLTSLSHLLSEISFAEVKQALGEISAVQLLLAALFTGASYLSMSLYDYQALKVIGRPQRWKTAATATTISYSLSNTLGFAALTGAAARFRVYRAKGLAAPDVARVIALAMGSFWGAIIFSSGLALLKQTQGLSLGPISLTHALCLIIGSALLSLIVILLGLIIKNHGSVTLYRFRFDLPNYKQALGLIGGACLDIGFCSAALYVLMPEGSLPSFAVFFALFSLAIALSLLSLIPGGVGVFEALMLLSVDAPKAQVLASLLGFRVIYYLMPLVIASIWLGVREGRALRGSVVTRVNPKLSSAAHMTRGFAPIMISSLVFLTGTVLLVSGSLPPESDRLIV
jgi:phosphatidylglycerol lysyltransferase